MWLPPVTGHCSIGVRLVFDWCSIGVRSRQGWNERESEENRGGKEDGEIMWDRNVSGTEVLRDVSPVDIFRLHKKNVSSMNILR